MVQGCFRAGKFSYNLMLFHINYPYILYQGQSSVFMILFSFMLQYTVVTYTILFAPPLEGVTVYFRRIYTSSIELIWSELPLLAAKRILLLGEQVLGRPHFVMDRLVEKLLCYWIWLGAKPGDRV